MTIFILVISEKMLHARYRIGPKTNLEVARPRMAPIPAQRNQATAAQQNRPEAVQPDQDLDRERARGQLGVEC